MGGKPLSPELDLLLLFGGSELLFEQIPRQLGDLFVNSFAIDSGIIGEELRHLASSEIGSDIEERVMADAAGKDHELRALYVVGKDLRVLRRRNNGIGRRR